MGFQYGEEDELGEKYLEKYLFAVAII